MKVGDEITIRIITRTELRYGRCHGLVGWWDESPRTKKIMPFKRAWSEEECLAMH